MPTSVPPTADTRRDSDAELDAARRWTTYAPVAYRGAGIIVTRREAARPEVGALMRDAASLGVPVSTGVRS